MYIMNEYDDAIREILRKGKKRQDRTGIGTISLFGMQKRYDISEYFPIINKRRLGYKPGFAELLWVLSGSTNNNDLVKLGCNFWTPWVDKKFEDKNAYPDGEFGPIYGWQLRHFGGRYLEYIDACEKIHDIALHQNEDNEDNKAANYWMSKYRFKKVTSKGFDQLKYIMDEIKNNPNSRRILISLWNPKNLDGMRLPPCHYSFQLTIDTSDKTISGMLTQRSADYPIGVPYNIIFYSALIYMIGQQTGYKPHEFIHSTGDSHIYLNQIEAVEEYIGRKEIDSPVLKLNKAKDIFSYTMSDFAVEEYKSDGPITIPVAV